MPRPFLIIEDNPMDLDLTLRAFRSLGMDGGVDIARDGEEALAWMERWDSGAPRPAVILLDLKLPKVDGFEVLRALKSHSRHKEIPVVVLTTSREDADLETAYSLGANSYLLKPVDYDVFLTMVGCIRDYWGRLNLLPERPVTR